jgi:hypothetical protein
VILKSDPYADVKRHRLNPETRRLIEEAQARRRNGSGRQSQELRVKPTKGQFVMVPGWWVGRLKTPRNLATYPLALQLLHLAWKSGSPSIDLSNERLVGSAVSRWAKWRALAELEELGLVTVERRRRKSPRVGVIFTEPGGGV